MLITVEKRGREWTWTGMQDARAPDIKGICDSLKRYWLLTERQVYYQLISSKLFSLDHWYKYGDRGQGRQKDTYKAIGPLLKWMRIDGKLSWDAITDENRITSGKLGFSDTLSFLNQELGDFLTGYNKCFAHRQEYYIEVWVEKAALYHIIKPVTDRYYRRLVACRGYQSTTYAKYFFDRAAEAIGKGQMPIVLYFGDWDPSGVDMLEASVNTLENELGLVNTEFHRCGINPEHFATIESDPVPVKPKDKRAKAFVEKHGTTAYELDALHPEELEKLVEKSIQAFTDMGAYNDDKIEEGIEAEKIEAYRKDIVSYTVESYDRHFS